MWTNMKITDYFERTEGVGVLATADANGKVDAAIYGRPHFSDDDIVAFIAAKKLTHANLQSNPMQFIFLRRRIDMKAGGSTSPRSVRRKTVH